MEIFICFNFIVSQLKAFDDNIVLDICSTIVCAQCCLAIINKQVTLQQSTFLTKETGL